MVYPETAIQASAHRINKHFLIPYLIGSPDLSQKLASTVDGTRAAGGKSGDPSRQARWEAALNVFVHYYCANHLKELKTKRQSSKGTAHSKKQSPSSLALS